MNARWLQMLFLLLYGVGANASYITIETTFTVTEVANGPVFSVGTRNKGDEPAYNVQVELAVRGRQFAGDRADKLDVNQNTDSDFRVGKIFDMPGRYPVVIKTHYQDANGYPFTALTAASYETGPTLGKILVRAEPLEIPSNGKGTLEFTIRNNDSSAHEVSVNLYLPDELVTVTDHHVLKMAPNSTEVVDFPVENFSALVNSGYSVVVLAGYKADGRYHGSTGSTVIRITDPTLLAEYGWLLPYVIGGVIVLLFVVIRVVRRRSDTSAG